jgi:hypothetical protein
LIKYAQDLTLSFCFGNVPGYVNHSLRSYLYGESYVTFQKTNNLNIYPFSGLLCSVLSELTFDKITPMSPDFFLSACASGRLPDTFFSPVTYREFSLQGMANVYLATGDLPFMILRDLYLRCF